MVLFLLWFTVSPGFRQFALSLNMRTLTIVQSWRIAGFLFLALYLYKVLPGLFALPAGSGDILVGATAIPVAIKMTNPDHRKGFIRWQVLGILDLVMAVTLATIARLQGMDMGAMTVLPLSLVPSFIVPLLMILHIICIAQARQGHERKYAHVEEKFAASEA